MDISSSSESFLSSQTDHRWNYDISTNSSTKSGQSSFEEFCGNSPFWDTDLLVDSSYPKFTVCFREVAVSWIPCMAYIVACIPYLYYLYLRSPVPPPRLGLVAISKTICSLCLIGISVATIIVRAVDDDQDNVPDALYVSEGLKAAAFCLNIIVSSIERRKCIVASAISWIFWLSLFILNIIPLYSNFKEDKQDDDQFGFIIFIFFYFFVIIALIIASFVEIPEETYQDISKDTKEIECPWLTASIPSRITFTWLNKLVVQGYKKTLEEDDVFETPPDERLASVMPKFQKTWQKQKEKVDRYNDTIRESQNRKASLVVRTEDLNENSPLLPNGVPKYGGEKNEEKEKSPYKKISVFKAIMKNHGFVLCSALAIKAVFDCFMFLTPKITEALLDYITNRDEYHKWRGYALAVSYLAVNTITSMVSTQAIFFTQRAAIRMKASLVNAIYRKSLTAASIGDTSSKGEINNLMSVSTEKIQEVAHYIHFLFSAPAQLIIAMVLLYEQLGVAVFAGLAVMVLSLPINGVCGYLYEKWQKGMMGYKDQRSSLLSEIFNGIKVLKLYAWEVSFQDKIKKFRDQELRNIIHIQYLVAVVSYFFQALPGLIQITAFAVHIERKGYLDPTVCFVSLQLFNMLTTPLMVMPLVIPGVIQAMVAVNRISKYLNKPDIKSDTVRRDSSAANGVEINNGSFTWTLNQPLPTLRNINMEVAPGSLVAVVGTVGCGKSSLISAILGEMEKLHGDVIVKGTTAYVPQEAWIQNVTLRDNIIFGKEFNAEEYDKIIEACALKSDLEILPGGDMTEIGEKGINISGGQKQRVSLARAVYSDRDIFLMDDPLSAVDSHVGKHIFEQVIGQGGVLKNKTRILVTHGIHWLPMVDKIFVMSNGEIRETGTYEELIEKEGDFARFIKEYAQDGNDEDETDGVLIKSTEEDRRSLTGSVGSVGSSDMNRPHRVRRQSSTLTSSMSLSKRHMSHRSTTVEKPAEKREIAKLTDDEIGMTGRVRMDTYLYYFKQVGIGPCLWAVLLYTIHAGGSIFAGIWLTEWTGDDYLLNRTNKDTDKYHDDTWMYFTVYSASSIAAGVFVFIFYLIAAVKLTGAARTLHSDMLANVLRSPMSFFDTTPIGRILNRFSLDVEVMDQTLPMSINQILSVLSVVVVTIVNICYGTAIFLVAFVPLSILYVGVQTLYIPTCRQLRRIESITHSPIYVHFSETLNGADSIRAYGCQKRFIQESVKRVDHNNKFYFAGMVAYCWLTVWLSFLGNMVIFFAAIFSVAATDIDPAIVGLSVSYASSMTEALNELVNGISEAETNIVSVERIREYSMTAQEAPWTLANYTPRSSWPDTGNIVFDNYQTRYRPGLDLVLKNLTCTIKGGEKIGIVGRTGAGKSSMTVALFRIIEAAGGRIVIDGEDVSQMGLHDLRSKLTILPQEPVIFCGTMRTNLDPFGKYSEAELWNALEHSYLKEFVAGLPEQLEYDCGEEGSNLSVGQRQLVCLARTLLRKTKILVLDEATAAVDMETDDLIQQTIRREFKDCTILTIAHRLNTIIDYDRVMVLDQGQIKEFDSPNALLADENTIFYGMAKQAGLV